MNRLLLYLLFSVANADTTPASDGVVVNVTDYGAVGDGVTVNTVALQRAIDACSAHGGGTLAFLAGRFLTGTIQIKDNVTLRLAAKAVILGSPNPSDYRNLDPFLAGDGVPQGDALIVAVGASHVGIEGTGTIDGQGRALMEAQRPYRIRPFLMRWLHCRDVRIQDVHLCNPGAWTLNLFQSRGAVVARVTIRTRDTGLSNNDGIDLDSCESVKIIDCDIDSGDDALCLKTSSRSPCRDIEASGCRLSTKCNAIKLGTESLGDFENISVTNCRIRNAGMAEIALNSVDGANIHDVAITNVAMDGVAVPICVRLGARLKTFRAGDAPRTTGTIRDVNIRDVRATGARLIGVLINGIPGHAVENLVLENTQIVLQGGGAREQAQVRLTEKVADYPEFNMFGPLMPSFGLYLRHVRGVILKNVRTSVINADGRPAATFVDVGGVTPREAMDGQTILSE